MDSCIARTSCLLPRIKDEKHGNQKQFSQAAIKYAIAAYMQLLALGVLGKHPQIMQTWNLPQHRGQRTAGKGGLSGVGQA